MSKITKKPKANKVKKPKGVKGKKPRKLVRKEKRKEKKQRKQEYYVNRTKPGKFVVSPNKTNEKEVDVPKNVQNDPKTKKPIQVDEQTKEILKDKKKQQKLEKEMRKQRRRQLQEANLEEDKVIKRLEKDLKLNKRKSKSVPKSFETDGLNYLLEMCDPENMKNVVSSEQQFLDCNDGFEEDFAMIASKSKPKNDKKNSDFESEQENSDSDLSEMDFFLEESDSDNENKIKNIKSNKQNEENISQKKSKTKSKEDKIDISRKKNKINKEDKFDLEENGNRNINSDEEKSSKKKPKVKFDLNDFENADSEIDENDSEIDEIDSEIDENDSEIDENDSKIDENDSENEELDQEMDFNSDESDDEAENKTQETKTNKNSLKTKRQNTVEKPNSKKQKIDPDISDSSINESESETENTQKDDTWEDIYGRKRLKDGSVLTKSTEKYIPPALRVQNDSKRTEKLTRLKKQLKGLLNRLAESNMHNISTQIEDLYMNNSRNDMNETLTQLIFDSLISTVGTPERLLLEHVVLITVLHANVGTEVGANFLLNVVKKFNEYLNMDQEVENKELDNTVHILAQLYNFKVFHAQLLYQILAKLSSKFEEKHVECILLVLKNVGFSLRKDDPIALKNIILDLQKKATIVPDDNSRVKFMLEILLAIKNNNVTKIPNYDTTYSEHLKKLLKGIIRKGNYVTQLNISLEDLLKADERGKWWVVGSAWTGMDDKKVEKENEKIGTATYSKKLLELAKKQRMNTDIRRNIFCIIMSAEDFLDAFEKLLHLGLKNQQEREIIHVILHCCLQEKNFNPYYAILAQKFCEYDRKYQMTIRCSIWDKLKALTDCSGSQLSNMAKLLTHLFIQQGLPISTLKVIEFGELDKLTLRFMRQVLLGVLLHEDEESCLTVFSRVATSPKLKMFRDSLRLFIHHFLLRNLKDGVIEAEQKDLLIKRAQLVERGLISSEHANQLV